MANDDDSILTPVQSRAGRALVDWSQEELGAAASLSGIYVRKFEKGERQPSQEALKALRSALEKAGVTFIPGNGEGPGVRLSRGSKGKTRGK